MEYFLTNTYIHYNIHNLIIELQFQLHWIDETIIHNNVIGLIPIHISIYEGFINKN